MDEPESWRWVWLAAAVVFGIGEMATPGAFFLAPFAIGAVVAATLAFADIPIAGEWAAFVGVSVACLFALRPLARRLDREGGSDGIGSRRLIGRTGVVLSDIHTDELGVVRVDREEWRAEAVDRTPIAAGTPVRVTDVEGTRVIVTPKEPIA
ncbi:MAG: NfeD family protein [Acidimicrobiales bacterium]|nr:NfeD family protein [Acidimicrobiales bacterium]